MIRLLLLAWCSVVLLATARGESIERAYYLGSKELLFWAFDQDQDDPDDSRETEGRTLRLKGIPYQSRYLREGDVLWDVSGEFAEDGGKRRLFERAIFNETTGYFVFKGEREVMDRIDAIARAEIAELPRMIQISAKVYRAKKKSVGLKKWNVEELERRHKSLLEAEVMTRVAQEVVVDSGGLKMAMEPQVGSADEVVYLDFRVGGQLERETFSIYSWGIGFNGISSVIELGSIGGEDTLLLVLKPEIILVGGVKLREAVLDVEKPIPSPAEKLLPPDQDEKWPIDPKTGKVFQIFQAPPTFVNFIDSGSASGNDNDPFSDGDEGEGNHPHRKYLLKKWDSRVEVGAGGKVLDLTPLLKQQGLVFGESDFAVLATNTGKLYAELSRPQMELLDAIVSPTGPHYPRMLTIHFSLIEGPEKIETGDLGKKNLKESFRSGMVAGPGRNTIVELKNDFSSVSMETEAQVGAGGDDVIDLRGEIVFSKGKDVLLEWKSGLTLISGKREIVASYRRDGKWYAFVVEARAEEMVDWLLGSE